ncbi:MAG: hypothetical protein IJ282_00465 [Lachnospiraceae bacterium]|nr:hypothetical protein [Lachnospiraceae bacterium]
MNLIESDFQILRLTDAFYATYPNPPYVEILKKRKRAYNCILFQTHYGYFICIPYRTEITHKYAYHFKNSARSRVHKSGLDYTKIVIIGNKEYIDNENALVDRDEYNETVIQLKRIKREALEFVEDYVAHVSGKKIMHTKEYKRRYNFSPLKYFHRELGIGD